ncbi:uncharacterized protein PG998_005432 [Apiospora kogelbergensis]|uniref:Prevent-host-death family protein n=1 Tax=Apiospora kogelbergensis TaxID=1337665 RepID=A0AAW0Q8W1_9PEZI
MKHSYADLQAAALRVLPEIITIRQSDHSRIAETNEPGAVLALPTARSDAAHSFAWVCPWRQQAGIAGRAHARVKEPGD